MGDLIKPISRIALRYGVGGALGAELATNPDMVALVAVGVGIAVERGYWLARKYGGAT